MNARNGPHASHLSLVGPSRQGTARQGTARQGTARQGTSEEGSSRQRSSGQQAQGKVSGKHLEQTSSSLPSQLVLPGLMSVMAPRPSSPPQVTATIPDDSAQAMARAQALHWHLRELIEQSSQPLALYGALLKHFQQLDAEAQQQALLNPLTDDLLQALQAVLPQGRGARGNNPSCDGSALDVFVLGLTERAALCHLLSQLEQSEAPAFAQALLEHCVHRFEPSLQAAMLDPDQARYFRVFLAEHGLLNRAVHALRDAQAHRRDAAQTKKAAQGTRRGAVRSA